MLENFCCLFQKKASQFPYNIAVEYLGTTLSYQELEKLSSLAAIKLSKMGIMPNDVVGVGLFNGIDLIIAILGILKAGGVFLPLDPNYPASHLNDMILDANAKLLLVDEKSSSKFSSFNIDKTQLKPGNLKATSSDKLPTISAKQPAYIIYTSGSTGKPKGIVVSHQSLKHSAVSFAKLFPSAPCSLLSGSISFDPSILVLFYTLCVGGKVCLYDNKEGIDPKNFKKVVKIIQDLKVELILATPSFYNCILEQKNPLFSLKKVFLCGEKIQAQLVHDHIVFSPNASLYNSYGPSEYAIGTTIGLVYDSVTKKQFPVTIGKPFGDNKLYVLDDKLQPVSKGAKGEFFVGGPGLALGYLNQNSLTEEKFIQCTHLEKQPIRLYRTGDIGYQLENKEFIFSGRKDFQVKIRGHRVELEEVELALSNCKDIEKAIVTTKNKNLIAFYSKKSKCVDFQKLKQELKQILPEYMLPTTFFEIQTWPVTNNGKIDRKRLIKQWIPERTIIPAKAS